MEKIISNPAKKTFFLDVLRGGAAIYVLIGHAKWLLWEGYTEGYKKHPELYGIFNKVQAIGSGFFGFGHEAVMLFFVLSGFVIHFSSYNQSQKIGGFEIGKYLVKRIKRIYPPFLFALLLTFLLDSVGKSLGYTIYSSSTDFFLMNRNIFSDLSIETLLSNIAMLQTIISPVWGTDAPLWSLMYEWWFYILYIPVFYINKRSPFFTAILVGLIFLLSLYIPIEEYRFVKVFNYFFSWYIGVVVADWYIGRFVGIKIQTTLLVCILALVVTAACFSDFKYITDYYVALGFAILIYLSLIFHTKLIRFEILQPLSDFSYTLYVVHMPILILLSGWLQQKYNGALPMHFGYVYIGIVVCLVIAWAAHLVVEKPFIKRR